MCGCLEGGERDLKEARERARLAAQEGLVTWCGAARETAVALVRPARFHTTVTGHVVRHVL